MKKILLVFIEMLFTVISFAGTYTATYECKDIKDSFTMSINIDHDSLHFLSGKNTFVFNYEKTITEKNNKKTLIHFFSEKNYYYTVFQSKNNPIDIYIDEYRNNKLKYNYKCKLTEILKMNQNKNGIPVTWRSVKDNLAILKKFSKPLPVSVQNKINTTLK